MHDTVSRSAFSCFRHRRPTTLTPHAKSGSCSSPEAGSQPDLGPARSGSHGELSRCPNSLPFFNQPPRYLMTGNNTHVVAVWVGFAGHSSPQGPPGGRGFTRTFAPKEVSPYDWQVGGGGGLSAGGAAGTLGLAPGFVFTCVCHGAAHSVATGSQESIPRQAVGAARPLRTWLGNRLGIAPALFPGQSACGDHLHPRGGGPAPPLRARRAERSAASLNHRIFSPFSLPHHHPRPTSPRR